MAKITFDKLGYINSDSLTPDIAYAEVKRAILDKINAIKDAMIPHTERLEELSDELSRAEHDDRTMWLLYDKGGKRKQGN